MPQIEASLLVASTCTGAAPGNASSSAGSWTSPPPPTTASTNPANRPARASSTSTVVDGSPMPQTLGAATYGEACASSPCSRRPPRSCSRSAPGDDVVGVTFECDHPAEARSRTIVSTSRDARGAGAGRDRRVRRRARCARGEDLYHLDEGALAGLDADLVVTQDLCAVCAVDVSVVDDALAHLGCTAEVLTIDPHTLDEVLRLDPHARRGHRHGPAAATSWWRRCAPAWTPSTPGRGPAPAAGAGAGVDRPAVRARATGCRRWSRRPAASRCWARPGEKSVRVTWEAVRAAAPGRRGRRAPCGYDLAGGHARWPASWSPAACCPPASRCTPVDANAAWARPGTRLVDGVEELAALLHPVR